MNVFFFPGSILLVQTLRISTTFFFSKKIDLMENFKDDIEPNLYEELFSFINLFLF